MSSDLTGLLQVLDQGPQDSANISNNLVLGFGADVAAEIIKINSHNKNILLQASHTPLARARSFGTLLKQLATLQVPQWCKGQTADSNEVPLTNEWKHRLKHQSCFSQSSTWLPPDWVGWSHWFCVLTPFTPTTVCSIELASLCLTPHDYWLFSLGEEGRVAKRLSPEPQHFRSTAEWPTICFQKCQSLAGGSDETGCSNSQQI